MSKRGRRQFLQALPGGVVAAAGVSGVTAAADRGMDGPLDYGRSFLQGKWAENRVRFWVESRTRIVESWAERVLDYYQCGSCKSENTFAERDLFHTKDNYDFLPVFGPEDGVIFRRKAWLNPDYRQWKRSAEMWEGQVYRLVRPRKVRLLRTNREIRAATHAGIPIVAQTEIADAGTGLRAIVEFPVKTMNIHDARDLYQVDSGPVALPDLTRRYGGRPAESLRLAYVAFNAPGRADFVIESPTALSAGGDVRVHHYSRLESVAAVNRLFACE